MQNEIICYAQDYKDASKLDNLIKSFLCNSNSGILTILYKNMDVRKIQLMTNKVKFINVNEIDSKYKVDITLSPYTLKVIYFYLYCRYFSKAENVFLCDATDVFINCDPFKLVQNNVSVFIEDEKIGKCPVNSEWIRLCYNQDILNLLGNKSILNGGLILGSKIKCLDLLKEMCLDISGVIGRIGNYRNLDQAVLNKVVYFDELNYHISRNNSMVNCAHLNNQNPKVEFKNSQIIINDTISPIVHQYPCFKKLEIIW